MRKEFALFAAFAAMLSIISFGAQAMPAAPLKGATTGQLTQVSGGCGPHRHRGPHGHCQPN